VWSQYSSQNAIDDATCGWVRATRISRLVSLLEGVAGGFESAALVSISQSPLLCVVTLSDDRWCSLVGPLRDAVAELFRISVSVSRWCC